MTKRKKQRWGRGIRADTTARGVSNEAQRSQSRRAGWGTMKRHSRNDPREHTQEQLQRPTGPPHAAMQRQSPPPPSPHHRQTPREKARNYRAPAQLLPQLHHTPRARLRSRRFPRHLARRNQPHLQCRLKRRHQPHPRHREGPSPCTRPQPSTNRVKRAAGSRRTTKGKSQS